MAESHDDGDLVTDVLEHCAYSEDKGLHSSMCSRGENCTLNSDDYSEKICHSEPKSLSVGDCMSVPTGETTENSSTGLAKSSQKVGQRSLIASVYRQDIVQTRGEDGVFGMVTRVAGESDSDSDDEDEDDGDSDLGDKARVIWSNLVETSEKLEDLIVVDRSFLHGDIVASVSDPKGQTGTVISIDLSVDLKTPSGEIKTNVPSRKLRRIRAFTEDDYVLHGTWLGRVVEVVDNVTVLFDDGSKCKVMRADPERLMPVSKNAFEDTHFPYYPGQRVRGTSSVVFKNARWLRGTWKACRMEGTVSNVEAGSIYVYWIASANPGPNMKSPTVPADVQDPKQLKLLSCFSYANWQLGDWCFLPAFGRKNITLPAKHDFSIDKDMEAQAENDNLPASDSSVHAVDSSPSALSGLENATSLVHDPCVPIASGAKTAALPHRKKIRKRRVKRDKKVPKKDDVLEWALLIVNTKTKVDVLWQDGMKSSGVDSKSLFAVDNLGEHDFWPEQYVLEKGSDEDAEDPLNRRMGVVRNVDSKERTAIVRWQKLVSRPEDPREFDKEEVVSVYDLVEHPDYNYFIGDIVIRLPPVEEASQVSAAAEMAVDDKTSEIEPKHKQCEIKSKLENCVKTDPPSEQKKLNRQQKSKLVVDIGDHSCDDNEDDFHSKCSNDTKSTEPSLQQGPSRRRRKSKVNTKVEDSDLSWIGNIIGVKDGDIEVMWADGTVSKVGPQAIFVVGRDDDMESTQSSFDEDDNDDAASWETVDDNLMSEIDGDEKLDQVAEPTKDHATAIGDQDMEDRTTVLNPNDNLQKSSDGSLRNAIGFVARIATGIFGFRGSKNSDILGGSSQDQDTSRPGPEENPDRSEMSEVEGDHITRDSNGQDSMTTMPAASEPSNTIGSNFGKHSVEDLQKSQDEVEVSTGDDLKRIKPVDHELKADETHSFCVSGYGDQSLFKHFDSVQGPADHYFFSETAQNINDRKWVKKVQQEWSLLERNLPETIYVRVYEDRIDLMRAVIIGASGTPYQDGLFFFDIYLPSDYPQSPPAVYYHSRGLRLNPNLYETGKVCLSLLNTWTGKGNEVWDLATSSILQVLVSLQGLVLNARPYFNEAGYDKQIGTAEGEKNSVAYNENSFLLTCKLMLYLLQRPPQHFEIFVKDHFRSRGQSILGACDAYMKGAEVGSLSEVPLKSDLVSQNNSSVGFRLMLEKLIPKLHSAFHELGTTDDSCL